MKYYSCILILILLFIKNISSYKIINTSPIDTKYRYYTVTGECEFKSIQILCIEDSINDDCGIVSVDPLDIVPTVILRNETSSLSILSFTSTLGKQSITINSVYTLDVECFDMDLEQVSFSVVNQYFSRSLKNLYTSFMAILKMDGIQVYQNTTFNFNPSFKSLEGCTFTPPVSGENYFILECTNTYSYTLDLKKPLNMTILDKQFIVKKYYTLNSLIQGNDYNEQINSDVNIYPGIQIKYMGYYESPVVMFTTNHSALKYNQFSLMVGSSSIKNVFRPIYGDEKSTTFLFPLNYYYTNIPQYTSYTLIDINGGKTFSTLFQQYTTQTPQINNQDLSRAQYLINGLPILNLGYSSDIKYGLVSFKVNLGSNYGSYSPMYKSFPYGFSFGSNSQYIYNISALVLPYTFNSLQTIGISSLDGSYLEMGYYNLEVKPDLQGPVVIDYQTIHLVSDLYLYRVGVNMENGYLYLKLSESNILGPEIRITGNSTIGIYEFTLPVLYTFQFKFFDCIGKSSDFENYNNYLSTSKRVESPIQNSFDIYSIKNVSFLYNNLNVSNHRHYNKLYFSYDNIQSSTASASTIIKMVPTSIFNVQDTVTSSDQFNNNYFYSVYNGDSGGFEIEFYVDANSLHGAYQFYLDFGNNKKLYSEFLNTTLYINYTDLDNIGPKFKSISNISLEDSLGPTNRIGIIGWLFTIEDQINGFKNGYIIVRGDLDSSYYNFTISLENVKAGGNQYLGDYEILLNLTWPCVSQNYIITEVVLYDQVDRVSYFSISPSLDLNSGIDWQSLQLSMLNPFIYIATDTNINQNQIICLDDPDLVASQDQSPPTLLSFSVSTKSIDVGQTASKRNVTFTFTAEDTQSGIKNHQYPIVYLTSISNRVLECKSSIVEYNIKSAKYSCSISLPKSFSYPNGILISVYGFINNNGLFSGYSTDALIENQFDYYINTTFTTNQPNIDRHFTITEKGGDLWLIGSGFDSDSTAYLKFNDSTVNVIKASIVYSTALLIQGIKSTSKPFEIYISSNSINSNNFIVTPTVFGFDFGVDNATNPISNKPQQCSGDPVCGGPTNGYCNPDTGCVCYSPWVLDCLSQVVIVDPPSINETNPSTEIILPGSNGGSPSFSSLISIVSLREVDILDEIVYHKSFDKWIVNKYDESTIVYNTALQVSKESGKNGNATVTVTLRWFTNETTIIFADEKLTINPSTIKYTIEISNYPFDSQLNQLEVIMSAYFESNDNSNDICSSKEFGETSNGDNSNYLKIQVDNHSLYARFVKRGIIDSRVTSITNVLLDKNMNPITKSNALQSYIGIQVPNFKNSIILDPDFSILLDSHSASSNLNSICSTNNSKLSAAKLAGIIIGCIAFIVVIIIIVSYHIIKKKKHAKFIASIDQKMKQMNK